MLNPMDQAQVYTDFQGLAKLRTQAVRDSGAALNEVTQQFEAYFLQQLLKNARAASFGDGLLKSDQERFFQGLFDQQLALTIAGDNGLGLAKVLREQIHNRYQLGKNQADESETHGLLPPVRSHKAPVPPMSKTAPVTSTAATQATEPRVAAEVDKPFTSPEDFVQRLLPVARVVASELGVDPRVLVAQAALETGWGKAVIHRSDGSSSHNLFGIKADSRWSGDTVHASTLEFEGGVMTRKREPFRAYASYAESFSDYLTFLRENPRYGKVLDQTGDSRGFVEALHQAGYATDPEYAGKILAILRGETLRSATG
jgi:flagellar protein FlgJ